MPIPWRTRAVLGATLFFGGSAALYLFHIDGPLRNGDEAIYAQTALEMAEQGSWGIPKWQGEPLLTRPPASLWVLATAIKAFGKSELVIRAVVALEAAAAVALLYLLGLRRYGTAAGILAALLLATADRFFVYARYVESEPLLILFVTGAVLFWEEGRDRPLAKLGWGACLGGALMTKQLVGALPLLMPLLDFMMPSSSSGPHQRRALWLALVLAALMVLPWHIYLLVKYGRSFVDAYFLANVLGRSMRAMHQVTSPWFYIETLWLRDKTLLLLGLVGLLHAGLKRDPLPAAWTLAVLVPYSIVASRYDYYALLAYPALALGSAWAVRSLQRKIPRRIGLALLAVPVVAHAMALGPRIGVPTPGDGDIKRLAQVAAGVSRPDDVLLLIQEYPFTARFYSQRSTVEVLLDWERYKVEAYEATFARPGRVVFVKDIAAFVKQHPRWFAIAKKSEVARLVPLGTVYQVDSTGRYILFTNLDRPQ